MVPILRSIATCEARLLAHLAYSRLLQALAGVGRSLGQAPDALLVRPQSTTSTPWGPRR